MRPDYFNIHHVYCHVPRIAPMIIPIAAAIIPIIVCLHSFQRDESSPNSLAKILQFGMVFSICNTFSLRFQLVPIVIFSQKSRVWLDPGGLKIRFCGR